MTETEINRDTWDRRKTFDLFRTYEKPHYSLTSRLDVSGLVQNAKPNGISTYRVCLFAIGAGIHSVPELMVRFRGDTLIQHDTIDLSMTVPLDRGGFGYAYVSFNPDFETFDKACNEIIKAVADGFELTPNTGQRDDLVYLSCLPWLDFTSLSNALPGAEDCIPRVSWGKFMEKTGNWDMAVAIEVHHALVDGEHLGRFFDGVQSALDSF